MLYGSVVFLAAIAYPEHVSVLIEHRRSYLFAHLEYVFFAETGLEWVVLPLCNVLSIALFFFFGGIVLGFGYVYILFECRYFVFAGRHVVGQFAEQLNCLFAIIVDLMEGSFVVLVYVINLRFIVYRNEF